MVEDSKDEIEERPQFGDVSNADQQATQLELVGFKSETFAGPIPHPDIIAGYEKILPGSADRILAMAERQEAHRQDIERQVIRGGNRRASIGLVCATALGVLIIVGSVYLISNGHDISGLATLFSGLITAGATAWIQIRERKDERTTRNRTRLEKIRSRQSPKTTQPEPKKQTVTNEP